VGIFPGFDDTGIYMIIFWAWILPLPEDTSST